MNTDALRCSCLGKTGVVPGRAETLGHTVLETAAGRCRVLQTTGHLCPRIAANVAQHKTQMTDSVECWPSLMVYGNT